MKLQALLVLLLAAAPAWAQKASVDFNRQVQPILSKYCFTCHGPDAETREADLRLDLEEGVASVVTGGDRKESELWIRVSTDVEDDLMPPPDHPKQLTSREKELLGRWIDEGGRWQGHWAFEFPRRPEIQGAGHPIDVLLRADHGEKPWSPRPEASRETLIRRLSFDLRGLPPSLAEIDAFLADRKAGAWERLVDRFLASPDYGERMAVWWLDGARYADTNGYQNDFGRSMWLWRDWVIKAFQNNQPFDQFAIEQIAGDLLPDASLSQKIATGFMRNNRSVTEGGSIEEEWRVENVMDRVETVSTVFMGLTMSCARCHDHKYDPISQREFFSFYAFFNNTKEKGFYNEARGNTPTLIEVPTEENRRALSGFDEEIAALEDEVAALAAKASKLTREHPRLQEFRKALAQPRPESDPQPLPLRLEKTADGEIFAKASAFGSSQSFEGTGEDSLPFAEGPEFEGDQSFSARIWVKPAGDGTVFAKMDADDAYRGIDFILIRGRPAAHLIHRWTDKAIKIVVTDPLPKGVWTPIALTYDGSQKAAGLKIYVAGREVSRKVHVDALEGTIRTAEPWRLGRRSRGDAFQGEITQLSLYDRALTPEEITGLLRVEIGRALADSEEGKLREDLRSYLQHHVIAGADAAYLRLIHKREEKSRYLKQSIPTTMVLEERQKRRPTYLLKRGLYDAPDESEVLEPQVPGFLPPLPKGSTADRLTFARWLMNPENPLTARVTVNRIWQEFFGQGLVESSENFGVRASAPSHPRVLDYLAREFADGGWDLKVLIKTIVTSAAYRRDSKAAPESWRDDPKNVALERGPRLRLSAEMLRDSALAASGLLVRKIGGPSVKPHQPPGLWAELAGGAGQGDYVPSEGEGLYRKSLYTYRKRTVPHATLSSFDAPSFEYCQVRRGRTNTPLQALARLNDETYAEAARFLARRILREHEDEGARLRFGFRLTTGRIPETREVILMSAALAKYRLRFSKDSKAARALCKVAEDAALDKNEIVERAAMTTLATLLLNLDEAVTKE